MDVDACYGAPALARFSKRALLAWIATFLMGDVYALVGALTGKGLALGSLQLQPPEYAALAALFSAGLVYPLYSWWYDHRPSKRFGALARALRQEASIHSSSSGVVPQHTRIYWHERLSALGIKAPHPNAGNDLWVIFLSILAPQAADRRIRVARRLLAKLESSGPPTE